ncbi:RstB [Pseudorhizobium halotolerans]|uniref:histidine kinase n=1 Tax=Pseudorhizobium halotolerans TaxID=1233081 RepID=A0ABM8PEV7_9HYPH|nr:sensor histidine kinase [Pseudorhizobium halotolerans]CAD7026046.1 RstB [Pseudorhizobium halotolerans]
MSFKIAARTILHLGSELISSDGIALYELIKNSYDAGAKNVRISVVNRLARPVQRDFLQMSSDPRPLHELKRLIIGGLIEGAPQVADLKEDVADASNYIELRVAVIAANYIIVADAGTGMTLEQLDSAFLTIGTRSKLREKGSGSDGFVVLGEKGIGRLSAMRLGSHLVVTTATLQDENWNKLVIDWSRFDHASDELLGDIALAPFQGERKQSSSDHGTSIHVSGFHREWSKAHVEEIARRDFAKLNDPFAKEPRFPIILKYNDEVLPIPRIEPWIFEHAHGKLSGEFRQLSNGKFYLSGRMGFGQREEAFGYEEVELLSFSDAPDPSVLRAIGPFEVEFYWYNRGLLKAMEGVGDLATVRNRLAQWTGGLLLYRDGFRVLPYGNSDDDWLDLDRKALARSGFKVNRAQLVGRVLITQTGNPQLKDQANREGLIDSEEKRAFQDVLAYLVQQTFWSFISRMEKAAKPPSEPVRQEVVEQRLQTQEQRLEKNLNLLQNLVPEVRKQPEIIKEIKSGISEISSVMADVRALADEYQEGRKQLLNLAGVGITVEVLAHELNRATETALETLQHMPSSASDRALSTLAAQLKTLQKRLKILDPLSTAGRNRREKIQLRGFLNEIMESHREQFAREGILCDLRVLPQSGSNITVTAVRGMIVQVLENLISNSVYWLKQAKRIDPDFQPRLWIDLDTVEGTVRFTDNGPGIRDEDHRAVFDPFFTKKPAGQGKGLGLFISREIAKYHKATLELERGDDGIYRSFVLDLGEMV